MGAITGAVGAAANGGNILQAAAIGALSGAAFHGVGQEFTGTGFWTEGGLGHIAAHGAVGGLTNVLQGGKFGHGFISAGLAKGLSVGAESLGIGEGGQFAAAVLAGGTASQLTGGKFANGATSAALAFAVNRLSGKAVKSKNKPIRGEQSEGVYETVQDLVDDLGDDGVTFGKRRLFTDGSPAEPPSENPPLFGDIEYVHEQVFYTERDARGELVLRNRGYFETDSSNNPDVDGMLRPERYSITDKNIGNYRFGRIYRDIPVSKSLENPKGFGAGQYNVFTNNCQDYCTLIRGSKN